MITAKVTRATTDREIILSWLTSKQSQHTQKQYTCTIRQFMEFSGKALACALLAFLLIRALLLVFLIFSVSLLMVVLMSSDYPN
jgi:hypothetical protein